MRGQLQEHVAEQMVGAAIVAEEECKGDRISTRHPIAIHLGITRGASAAAASPVVPGSSGVIDVILNDSIPPWLNLHMHTTSSADVALPHLGLRSPQTGLESSQHGPLPWAMLSIRPASMSRSHYYNGAVWRSSITYAAVGGGHRPIPNRG